MLTKEELLILGVAATDDLGEYFVSREYNKPWGERYAAMKHLEELWSQLQNCLARAACRTRGDREYRILQACVGWRRRRYGELAIV